MNPRRQALWSLAVVIFGLLVAAALVLTDRNASRRRLETGFLPGNPGRGGELFYARGCARCHAVAGVGGKDAPDLAHPRRAPADLADIAGAMWNHAPTMWKEMESGVDATPSLAPREFIDLMAFLFTAGYLEEEGNPARGETLLMKKGCLGCHTTGGSAPGTGPDLSRWSSSMNSILWAQLLWNHAPTMEEALREKDLSWPELSPPEAADLLAFLRSIGSESRTMPPLPGDPWVGKYLFRNHCQPCHSVNGEGGDVGPDLGARPASRTIAGLAAALWNHVPAMDERMKELDVERPVFSEQEMADLITYVFAVQYYEVPGDPDAGAEVYSRSCSPCHGEKGVGDDAPSLRTVGARTSASFMASTLWNHGPEMYGQIRGRGLEWPLLQQTEMRDLIEYLRGMSSNR